MAPKKGVVPAHLKKYLFKKRGHSMAKRKYVARAKTAVRKAYSYVKRKTRRSYKTSQSSIPIMDVGFSLGYGYGRGWVVSNEYFKKVVDYLPFGGQYKDNIFLGLGAYLINWFVKPTNRYVRLGLRTIVNSEAFLVGAKMKMGYSMTETVGTISSSDTENFLT